ncbi:MAG: hypothetical protein IKC72_07135 [Clostridia bacterium]|nr:hypothetical protein [Clostridia bacterium]
MLGSAFFEDLQIKNISVLSGVRTRGRTVDFSTAGRRTHGMLYLSRGECTFFLDTGEVVSVREGELAYLPKHEHRINKEKNDEKNKRTFCSCTYDMLPDALVLFFLQRVGQTTKDGHGTD